MNKCLLKNIKFIEHLCEFAKYYFKDERPKREWTDSLSEMMLEKGIAHLIKEIEKLPKHPKTTGKGKRLLNYYRNNKDRVQYHQYLEKGLLIGSGTLEPDHKGALQQRLKLSGPRWTMEGFQQMAQLRLVYKSKQENRIIQLCQNVA